MIGYVTKFGHSSWKQRKTHKSYVALACIHTHMWKTSSISGFKNFFYFLKTVTIWCHYHRFGTAVAQNKLAATGTEVPVHTVKVTCLMSTYSIKVVGLHICISTPTHLDKSRLLRFTKPSFLYNCAILHALFHIKFHKFSINLPDHKVTLFVPLYYDCHLKSDQISHLLLRIAIKKIKTIL
jgi:hypothetical protein